MARLSDALREYHQLVQQCGGNQDAAYDIVQARFAPVADSHDIHTGAQDQAVESFTREYAANADDITVAVASEKYRVHHDDHISNSNWLYRQFTGNRYDGNG